MAISDNVPHFAISPCVGQRWKCADHWPHTKKRILEPKIRKNCGPCGMSTFRTNESHQFSLHLQVTNISSGESRGGCGSSRTPIWADFFGDLRAVGRLYIIQWHCAERVAWVDHPSKSHARFSRNDNTRGASSRLLGNLQMAATSHQQLHSHNGPVQV